jgi:D-amino-acid dehydrogenase
MNCWFCLFDHQHIPYSFQKIIMKTDILIIGGSSIGLNCAYYLLKSGRKVTILEANEVAKGNASGNAGQIVPSHIVPLAAPGVASSALKWM